MTYGILNIEFQRNGNLELYLSTVLFALERQMNGQNDYPVLGCAQKKEEGRLRSQEVLIKLRGYPSQRISFWHACRK